MLRPNNPLSLAGPDGVGTLVLSSVIILLNAGFSFIVALLYTYHKAKSPWKVDGHSAVLVTLGKRLDDGEISPDYKLRLDRASSLYSELGNSHILILGGRRGDNEMTEAEAGRDYLLGKGVSKDDILVEDKSLHTLENLQEARKLIVTKSGHMPALITNRYHLARCGLMANRLGIRHTLRPAEKKLTLNSATTLNILVEAFYVHWYVVGMIFSEVTKNKKMRDRIR